MFSVNALPFILTVTLYGGYSWPLGVFIAALNPIALIVKGNCFGDSSASS